MAGKPIRSRVGTFSSTSALLKVDNRTVEGRLMREVDEALYAQYGGLECCSAARVCLIRAASADNFRITAARARLAAGGEMPDHFERNLSGAMASLRATLLLLGLDAPSEPELSLEQYAKLRVVGQS